MQISPYSSSIPPVFAGYVSSRNSDGIPLAGASIKGGMGKTSCLVFSSFMRQYLENGRRYVKVTIMTNRKLHMGFRLAPKSMTLDDFELDGGRPPLFSNT